MSSTERRAKRRSNSRTMQLRAADSRFSSSIRQLFQWWNRSLESYGIWLGVLLVIGVVCLLPQGSLKRSQTTTGEIAAADVVAPRDLEVVDPVATETARQRARNAVLSVYDLDAGLAGRLKARLDRIFSLGRRAQARAESSSEDEKAGADERVNSAQQVARSAAPPLRERFSVELAPGTLETLRQLEFSRRLQERLGALIGDLLGRGVVANETRLLSFRESGITVRNLESGEESTRVDLFDALGYPEEVRSRLESDLMAIPGIDTESRAVLVDFLTKQIRPNLVPNRQLTLNRKEAAAKQVDPVTSLVRRGQIIVRKGDRVGPEQAAALAVLRGPSQGHGLLLRVLGAVLLIGLVSLLLWLAPDKDAGRSGMKSHRRVFAELILLLAGAMAATRFLVLVARALGDAFGAPPLGEAESWYYAIPFAALAMVAALLYGRRQALLLSLAFAVLAALMVGPDLGVWTAAYVLIGSLAAMRVVEGTAHLTRASLLRVGLILALAQIVWLLTWVSLSGGIEDSRTLLFRIGCALVGGLLAGAVASFVVPVLEVLFSITTDIKLVELANTNLPLLQRLAMEAPGTFQHSLMVANLAKAGASAIGADAVLCYTGGLYHDVGKMVRPEYFIENQRGAPNPHDALAPTLSATIVVSHVKDGLELARQHHLPQSIIDAIQQHHGTRRLTYFFSRAAAGQPRSSHGLSEEKFRYPGPRPRSRAMAVLMLADGVEAASRTLVDPSPARLRSVVRAIVDDCIQDRQLDHADVTLSDLRRISESFLSLLANVHHRRVDYPGFDFEPQQTSSGPRLVKSVSGRGR